ncbi:MAG: helix-turn-helix domain-containing protein [Parvibaculum sp.]
MSITAIHAVSPRSIPGYAAGAPAMRPRPDTEARGNVSLLRSAVTTLKVERNQTIYSEGERAQFSYRVVSGAVRLCKLFPDGRRQISDFCLAGDFFGFASPDDYTLTAEAVSDAMLVRYASGNIDCLGQASPDLRDQLMTLLYRGLSDARNHLFMLGRQTVKERVTSFLLMMLERQGYAGRNGDRLDLPMGRQDIADYLGLTIETVCRALSDLKRSGVITAPSKREIVVKNADALRATAAGDA